MKTKPIIVATLAIVVLLAFITNPKKSDHADRILNHVFEKTVSEDNEISLLIDGMFTGFARGALEKRIKVNNYYLFSTSTITSERTGKTIQPTVGFFGQVFIVTSDEKWENFSKVE